MKTLEEFTICELIDIVISPIVNPAKTSDKIKFDSHVDLLSKRLNTTKAATIIFSFIFYRSSRGYFPTKHEITSVLPEESTTCLYLSIQELYRKEFVKSFRNSPRRPEILFYTPNELDKLIINNTVPKTTRELFIPGKSTLNLRRLNESEDYAIFYEEKSLGIVYSFITDEIRFSAVVNSELIAEADTLDEIIKILNQLIKDDKLNIS